MPEQKDTYNIVLLGGMNPRIHHPSWYRFVGLFDDEEVDQAVKAPNTFVVLPMAQIETPKFTIVCQDDKWEIKTLVPDQVQRLQDITSRLFDDILPHTPLMAAGFNFFLFRVTAREVGSYLASSLANTPLGLKRDNLSSGEVTLRRVFDDHTSQVSIKPAPEDAKTVLVHHNFEYKFMKEGPFKLGDVIARRYGVDRSEAEEQTELIVSSINRSTQD